MEDTYENAFTEVLEIIKYLPDEEKCKIPRNELEYFEDHKNKNYNFVYSFSESKHLRKTDIILISLFRKYIADSNEIDKIDELLKINEKIKDKQWDNKTIFKEKEKNSCDKEKALVLKIENKSIIKKIIDNLKKFLLNIRKD